MAEQIQNPNAGVQTPGAQNNNAQQNNQQPVQGTVTVTANNGQQQGTAPAGMAIALDPTMLAALLGNPQVQANLANGQTVQVGTAQQQQAMMQQLQNQGVQVPGTTPVAPQIPGTAAPAQNPQQPAAEKPGFFARIKDGVLQFIIKHSGWFIIITVASTALITLGCVYLYNKCFGTTTTQVVADNNRKFNEQRDMIVRENNALANRDNYQKVNLGSPTSVAKSLCMRLY